MGILVGIEGIDGSGKTSVVEPLVEKLKVLNIHAKALNKRKVDYPDSRIEKYTKAISELIWYKSDDPYYFVTSQGWLYLHAIWYTMLIENEILPSLTQYDVIIVDGWYYKIYSKFLLKDNFNKNLLDEVIGSLRKCDKVFMLDVNPSICWNRREKFKYTEMGGYDNNVEDPYTSYINYQGSIRNIMREMAQKDDWFVVDTNKLSINDTVNVLSQDIIKLIKVSENDEI